MKHYEELTGGEGRRVFYRAERFKASTILRDISPVIELRDRTFEIYDLSMSGLSFLAPATSEWQTGEEEDFSLSLKLGADEVFQGTGKISRIADVSDRKKVALELTNGYLDIQKIIETHDDLALNRHIRTGLLDQSSLVPADYKEIVADALYLLRSARQTLQKVEQEFKSDSPRRESRINDVIIECEQHVHSRWKELSKRAMVTVNSMRSNPEAMQAAKAYTEKTLTPELVTGASWGRAYEKPLGYPGDYEVMNYAYNLALLGDTAYDKLCHRLGTSTGEFIAARMTMVKQKIAELAAQAAAEGQTEFRAASLGCGPAQEVANFLQNQEIPLPVHFTLIDQDHDALSYAYKNSYPEVVRLDGRASVNCLHATFVEFLATGALFEKLDKQDLIYAVGLVDYLTDRRACKMVDDLYASLRPGGTLLIGSMKDSDISLEWQVEFITDWQLEYRTEEEMLNMAVNLPADATLRVLPDSTGHCHILEVKKPE
ncbi:hypothetical protein [Sneathiella chinensis]|uniref:PilZ domain-containing protein n=1 Tax=Sneathiella chinensis TaxID=349750 RepID=A0ABQ5UBC9_9PROT|nr:hypothetical protein [Sneathiella chinensis]GLQ07871.1 hypothetical protein GCM10007924_30930 [Sneathiella chinensis]